MATPKKIILLACGSFNPPTHMHLRIFEIARDYLHRMGKYQVVAGLMSPVHDAYGKKDLASSSDRCEMVRRSLQSSDWIHLSDWECHQTGWTPTRQVLHQHQELVDSIVNGNLDSSTKRQRTEELAWARELGSEQLHMKLLCGGDLLESFGKPGLWKDEDIEAIVGLYGLVVITREGSNPLKFIYDSDVLTRLQRNIDLVTEWIANEVSSSRIRRALGRCESVKYLLPDPVITYVHQRGLYGASSEYVRPLSLLLVPGMPPSFLTPSPCDVDMTYCERPVLTLTAPDASTAADDRSPPACRTASTPPRPAPATSQPRQESGRCRTWRRGGEKKPGSSRRVRPEPAAKVSCGDGGSEGDTGRGSQTSPPPQQRQAETLDGPGCETPSADQGDCYRADQDGGPSPVAGSVEEEGELGRDGGPLPPPEPYTAVRQNGDGDPPERDVTDRRGSCGDDLKDRPPPEPPCNDTAAVLGDCGPQPVSDTDAGSPELPPAPATDTTAVGDERSPPVISASEAHCESDRIDNHPRPSPPERRDTTDHDRRCQSPAGVSTGQTGHEVDQDGNPPPPEPPPPFPSSPAQGCCRPGNEGRLPSITVTEHGSCGGTDDSSGDGCPSPEPSGRDAADGDRIRIELRQDGVTVVSGRETQL